MSDTSEAAALPRASHPRRSRPTPRLLQGLLFAGLVFVAIPGLHAYLASAIFSRPGWPAPVRIAGWALVMGLYVATLVSFITRRIFGREGLSRALQTVVYFWLGSFTLVLLATVVSDLASGVFRALAGPLAASHLQQLARGQALLIVGTSLVLVVIASRTAMGKATVERIRVPLPGLGAGLEGLRIVQISDVHIGETLRRAFLERVVEQVNALDPDIVAVTGDLVDGTVTELRDEVAPLSNLRARHGVYYVTGNHEYYWGGAEWEAEVARLGVTVLHNEHRIIQRGGASLALGGVTDIWAGSAGPSHASRPDVAFAGVPEGLPRVLLAHQPKSAEAAARAGAHLMLAGHTHGGQIFPFNFFVRLQQPIVQGLKRLHGIWVYAHRGTGFWGPAMRLGPTPEIAEITLTRNREGASGL